MATITPEQIAALPPEFFAADVSQPLEHVSIAFIVLTTVVFAFFVFTKSRFPSGAVDWVFWVFIPLAYLCAVGLAITGLVLVKIGGAGRHAVGLVVTSPSTITTFLQLQTAAEFLYTHGIFLPKVAMLALYLKVIIDRKTRIATWAVMGLATAYFFSILLYNLLICRPINFKWNKSINGTCGDLMTGYRYGGLPNLVIDVFIVLLPLPTIYHLHVSMQKKIGVFVTFLVGSMGIIIAIIRTVYFFTTDLFADPTYNCIDTMTATIIEPGAYFICACLPHLRPLVRLVWEDYGLGTSLANWAGLTYKSNHRHSGDGTVLTYESRNVGRFGGKRGYEEHTDELELTGSRAGKAGSHGSSSEHMPV